VVNGGGSVRRRDEVEGEEETVSKDLLDTKVPLRKRQGTSKISR